MIDWLQSRFINKKEDLNNAMKAIVLVQISIIAFGLRVYSTRYIERNTEINIEINMIRYSISQVTVRSILI